MLIEINTDKNIENSQSLMEHFKETLNDILSRFDEQITRLEVHLSDENGKKDAGDDKKCILEARMKGLSPIAVTHIGGTVHQSVKGAAEKLRNVLDKANGQRQAVH